MRGITMYAVGHASPPFRLLPAMAVVIGFCAPIVSSQETDRAVQPDVLQTSETRGNGDACVGLVFDNPGDAARLIGRDAQLQLVVTAHYADGQERDATHRVSFAATPAGIVVVDREGWVAPLGNGAATITAFDDEGRTAQVTVEVTRFDVDVPVSFPGQVVPLFTKMGCNGGGCHGKASGQNGFRLSLLGFGPREDYTHLVSESRGRRLFPAAPDRSLLLLKATNAAPHGGGQRLDLDGRAYRLLRRWIEQGMPYGSADEPVVQRIEVVPAHRQLPIAATQQLAVIAHFSDGTTQDVSRDAQFDSNDPEMAEVTLHGAVRLGDLPGDVAIMARYQGHVALFRADIPWRQSDAEEQVVIWPEPRNLVDAAVFKKLRSLGISPSSPCDDATYLRRVTLDVVGRLPTLAEIDAFAADARPDRRDLLLERLLSSDDYADFFACKWNAILRNQRPTENHQLGAWAFHRWIRDSIRENKPYDVFVRQILTASGTVASNPPVVWFRQVPDTQQRVEDAAQLFLGQRIQCAHCHHHPYEKWSQRDYAQMSAFFSLVVQKEGAGPSEPAFVSLPGVATAPHPKTGEAVQPAGLDGPVAKIQPTEDPRTHLVDWMVQEGNPFFAKALANRYWKHFMGRGLVEPEDDLRVTNPPSNPELLDVLADGFVESGFDLKAMVRLICQSQVYALDSRPLAKNLLDRRSYSRFYPKRLTAEVLLDAVDVVTQTPSQFAGLPPGTRAVALPDTGFASYFLTVFGRPAASTACECERSQEANLAQSLHLLNSEDVQQKLAADASRAARLASDDSRPDAAKIRELYLVAFSRPPRESELQTTLAYLEGKSNAREAYEDVVWSLINSKEFMFNH